MPKNAPVYLNRTMQQFGLIGYPISHSLSPSLFKAGYDGKYSYVLIEEENFEKAYQRFIEEDFKGINVTAPFKEKALKKADIISDECHLVGATNLLIKTPEGIKAHNSDYLGVRLWLSGTSREAGSVLPRTINDKPTVLVIGSGGAGKAAAAAALSLGMETTILNRTQYSPEIRPLSDFRKEFRKADIVIYNLPVRIQELDTLTDEDFTPGKKKYILEANYHNPSFDNSLIQRMKKLNSDITYTGGSTWLLLQALTGYEIFTGEKPDLAKMTACL